MATTKTKRIASKLENLPLELIEPVLANLTFGDIIALSMCAENDGQLARALAISPSWKEFWPIYAARKSDFQMTIALKVPVGGGKWYDASHGELDITPGMLRRKMARGREIHGDGYDFLEHTLAIIFEKFMTVLVKVDLVTLTFLCQELSLETIAVIAPWMASQPPLGVDEHRRKLYEAMKTLNCACSVSLGPYSTPAQRHYWYCPWSRNHTDRSIPGKSLPQMKAFMDGYAAAQLRVNTVKSQQLEALATLYARHHSRLKMPLAPQSPRQNTNHIPQQLTMIAEFIPKIIDLDRCNQPTTSKHGHCRFRYPHACLIPYDWCLRLWTKVIETHPSLLSIKEQIGSIAPKTPSPPAGIFRCLQISSQGLNQYYEKNTLDGVKEAEIPCSSRIEMVHGVQVFSVKEKPLIFPQQRSPHGARPMILPIDDREMEWLEAFLTAVEWMEDTFPELSMEAKA
ncbi:hypothetical protein QBC40DRAFT_291474 [Triangularia verruculosa]|uniref:F-box domain-containing protein n=1 Tax=Triangularia verruculosa TaxID=2587418 RepID=A0AAN6X4R8_9PEZI|nr:hypothetical protein QBC40DRAFT_291474 [Triangularia verruculosa]